MNRDDFQMLAQVRLDEAEALLRAGHFSGAYYLAGYAVECALKACIARATQAGDFPDLIVARASYTHDLEKLVGVAGLKEELDRLARSDQVFQLYWSEVSKWTPDSRYATFSHEEATSLYTAIADTSQGVLGWLRRYY